MVMSVKASSTVLAVFKIEVERYKTSVLNHCEITVKNTQLFYSSLTSCRISTDARESSKGKRL